MGVRKFIKAYWRIILLTLFISVALVALFIPGGIIADDDDGYGSDGGQAVGNDTDQNITQSTGWTNLVYGLSLEGGTRISAPVTGMTVDDIQIEPDDLGFDPDQSDGTDEFGSELAEELGVQNADTFVRYDPSSGFYSAEVFTDNVSEQEFADALNAMEIGLDVDESDVENRVTQDTRDNIIYTIDERTNEAGLSGSRVTQSDVGGQFYIVTEVPDMTPQELRSILSDRGTVEVWAHHPGGDGGEQINDTVLESDDLEGVDPPDYSEQNGHHVPVSVTQEKAPEYQQQMNDFGFTSQEGIGNCDVKDRETREIDFDRGEPNYCLLTVVDGEVVDAHSMSNDLAGLMSSGQWENDRSFIMGAPSYEDAQALSVNLRAGALLAPLDFENDQVQSIQPALADQFKQYSLIIGVLSVLTVSGVVYLRYADRRVAVPMIVTALAEVVILLGFAAAIRMPLGLAEVAGFIAVVGTGVDDLVIIADEVMSEGDVNSRRVFESRFRKAFWVIGAAAGTTIIAMSPLAVLDLGDLRGFAIITILGVLIGVLITRPAYGDILRYLMTDR